MPEVAGSWPEEGTQYVPGAPMEPAQQAYPQQAPYQTQQPYQQQGYTEPQYHQAQGQQQYGAPQAQQQQYPQEQTVPQQAVFAEEEQSALPSEFDHLFRDSDPDGRRAISGRQPMVSGPGASPSPGFQQAAQQQQQAQPMATQQGPAATAMYNQQPQDYAAGPSLDYNNGPFSYDGPPGGGGSDKKRTPLIIGAVVAVIAVVGLYLGLSGGGGSGKTNAGSTTSSTAAAKSNETAQQEADAVYQLVSQAKQLREDIVGEVSKLRSCDIADAQSQLSTTATARQNAATKVATLPVDKIGGAGQVLTALQKGWQDSATSDADYAKAAADFANGGCSLAALKKDANYQQAEDTSSTADKKSAATLWNSIMTKYEPSVSGDDL